MGRRWLLLTLSFAACGGNAQLRTEVDSLRAEIAVMEARQAETEQRQQPTPRKRVRPSFVVESGEPPVVPHPDLDVVARVRAISDEVCACKDMPCATRAMEKMGKLAEGDQPGELAMKEISKSMGEMTTCMVTLASKVTP